MLLPEVRLDHLPTQEYSSAILAGNFRNTTLLRDFLWQYWEGLLYVATVSDIVDLFTLPEWKGQNVKN